MKNITHIDFTSPSDKNGLKPPSLYAPTLSLSIYQILPYILAFLIISMFIELPLTPHDDLSAFVYQAREYCFGGIKPYTDIIDINPPMMTWLMMPPVVLAHYGSWTPEFLLIICRLELYALLVWSLLLTHVALPPLSFRRQRFLMAMLAFMVLISPAANFGERDQIIMIALLPLILLACRAAAACSAPSLMLSMSAGILAFMAVAMKPHYLLVAALPECLVLMRGMRLGKLMRRPELLTVTSLSLLYAAIILIFYPGLLPMARRYDVALYIGMADMKPAELIPRMIGITPLILLVLRLLSGRIDPLTVRRYDPLLLAVFAAWMAFMLQRVGFKYQLFPAELLMVAWLVLIMPSFALKKLAFQSMLRPLASLFVMSALIFVMIPAGSRILRFTIRSDNDRFVADARRLVQSQGASGQSILFIGTALYALPLVIYEDMNDVSRWGSVWPLPGEFALPESQRGRVADDLASDIARYRPPLILVDLSHQNRPSMPKDFDFLAYLSNSTAFRTQWADYHLADGMANQHLGNYVFAVYVRNSSPSQPGP